MKPVSPFGLPIGISIAVWSFVGLLRLITEKFSLIEKKSKRGRPRFTKSDIAVLLPAHNEEVVIRSAIRALKELLDVKQIYVASDGSNDRTSRRARMEGCHVSSLAPGLGKAKALVYLLKRHRLFEKYKLIFIVDADTRIDKYAFKHSLPMFRDPEIGVVFASSQINWPHHIIPKLSLYFVAYRDRLNRMLQYFLIYGQTWKYTNVNYVIPGFATLYRSDVLSRLEIDTPGILIEDFNLAFQVHKRKIAKIGYSPSMIGWDQYPTNLMDYCKQIRRWNIGFFQTIRKNGIWPSMFWLTLGVFTIEVLLNSIFILFLPFYFIVFIGSMSPIINHFLTPFANVLYIIPLYKNVTLGGIFLGVFLIDYLLTVIIGLINKKPQFLFYGLFFFFLHFVTSVVLLTALVPGLFGKSSGKWTSPTRQ